MFQCASSVKKDLVLCIRNDFDPKVPSTATIIKPWDGVLIKTTLLLLFNIADKAAGETNKRI